MKKQILIIDDDIENCKQLKYRLQSSATDVYYALSVRDALEKFAKYSYQLVIMELHLSEIDGFVLLDTLRKAKTMPILILSSRAEKPDKLAALDMGADDYITKPYDVDELLARAQAHLRRYTRLHNTQQPTYTLVCCRNLIIDPSYRTVTVDNQPLELTNKEFDILYYFALNPGRVLSKEQIYSNVWQSEFDVDENAIRCHINRLRSKLGDMLADESFLETVRGIGYRFTL